MKIAVVTGANKGIGFAIVKKLCEEIDGNVYLTARDIARGESAVQKLKELGLSPKFHQLDIDDETSIFKFCDYLKEKYGGIDYLINNAAIAFKVAAKEPISVQAEETIRVNFYGTLNVCNILFPLLRTHARVVNISSALGFLHHIPSPVLRKQFSADDLTVSKLCELVDNFVRDAKKGNHKDNGWPDSSYAVSKVGISALTRIQQREFDQNRSCDIIVNHVHPGYVDTDMTSHKGAKAPVYLALLPHNIDHPKGDYVWYNKRIVDWVNGPLPSEA